MPIPTISSLHVWGSLMNRLGASILENFFPTRMGKPPRSCPVLHLPCRLPYVLRGSPFVARRRQNRKLVFPTCMGGVPAVAAGNMLMEQSSLHVRGSSTSRPVPHAPDATFRKAGSLSVCTACAPMLRAGMDAFHAGRSFPARFLLCSLQETAMRNNVGAAGCRFAEEYT